ncbi:TetR/AcrR family transcriptional repressor of nem operon [Mucilaginibacter sp. UYP25]|uniref:TetR/AcrR family transcriptional regulator n=1 Tax=unclassified Mucilaginibacter TaxID=2617802 RepID=UPI0033925E24
MNTKAERTRQFIIEQTAPVFNIKGVASTAISDIMGATNMGKGSLYTHFTSKEELAYSVVDFNLNQFFVKAATATDQHRTAKNKLFAFLDFLHDPVNHPIKGGCPMLNFGMEVDDTNPVIREKVHVAMNEAKWNIAVIIKKGITDGEFRKEWDADEYAIKIFAMLEGGVLMSRVHQDSSSMKILINIIKREVEAQFL